MAPKKARKAVEVSEAAVPEPAAEVLSKRSKKSNVSTDGNPVQVASAAAVLALIPSAPAERAYSRTGVVGGFTFASVQTVEAALGKKPDLIKEQPVEASDREACKCGCEVRRLNSASLTCSHVLPAGV